MSSKMAKIMSGTSFTCFIIQCSLRRINLFFGTHLNHVDGGGGGGGFKGVVQSQKMKGTRKNPGPDGW
jgi:hypothetical protein